MEVTRGDCQVKEGAIDGRYVYPYDIEDEVNQ